MLKKCHFIGIGGIGMSGLARLVRNKKIPVTGSDVAFNAITDLLGKEGVEIFLGHSANHIKPDTTVIYSTDIKKDNPEFLAALKLKCQILHRSELLHLLMEEHHSLAVAGTHGKTTTSSLLTWVLESCGESPSYALGGFVPQFSSNSGQGTGQYFVAEACESDGTFLNYSPYGAIVTNIDLDHMDFYKTEKALLDAFKSFIEKVTSNHHLFWCGDDLYLQAMQPKGVSYGFREDCQLKASNFHQNGWTLFMDVTFNGKSYPKVEVALIGKHNALNALAVFGMALSLGIPDAAIRKGLRSFEGVMRRCEKKGEIQGMLFLDDYAHHPTELKATLNAIRKAIGERRLVVAYQPHRYTRTQDCIGMYHHIFDEADALFITEIYPAREAPIPGISHEIIIKEAQKDLKSRCCHIPRDQLASKLAFFLRPHDVLLTLGAGDITKLCGEVMEKFTVAAPQKLKVGLIFGGMSVEHEISLISSENIFAALNTGYYEIQQFGITRRGNWHYGAEARQSLKEKSEPEHSLKIPPEIFKELLDCDILFPILHGTCGEDGTIQGFFDLFSKAYVGCDHRSSAISMDKTLTKRLVQETGIAVLPFLSFDRYEWETKREELIKKIHQELTYPLFVKPVHLGSSIGVHKVANSHLLEDAIGTSFSFDTRLIIENGLENVREIEFSLLGNDEITVFPPGEIYTNGHLHDYDSKYGLNPTKPAAKFEVKATLSEDKVVEGMALAKAVYQTIGCTGMARIDTFLDSHGKFWFNEINPIPGFTNCSLYPLMCAANGLSLDKLLDRLIALGLQRRRHLDQLELNI